MSQVGGNLTTYPPTNSGTNPGTYSQMNSQGRGMCDHCHLRPKFPSYNYCGKRCGAKASAVGSQTVMVVLMCKQCNNKPTYLNHEFCGRRCARAWATDHGQPITGSLARPPSPDPNQPTIQLGTQPQNQNPGGQSQNQQTQGGGQPQNQQTGQGSNQPGQKRKGVKGFVKGFKKIVSSNPPQQPQPQPQQPQQQMVTNPVQTQQRPSNASSSTLNFGSHTIPLVLKIPTGSSTHSNTYGNHLSQSNTYGNPPSHHNGPNVLGPFNGAYPISPSHQYASTTSNIPSQTTGGSSSSNQVNKFGPFNGAYQVSPPSPTNGGTGNQNNKSTLGPLNGSRPISTLPTQSLSSGSSALQNPNDTTPGTTPDTTPVTTPGTTPAQQSDNAWKELSQRQRSHSSDSLSYASEDEDTGAVPGQASGPDQATGKDGDSGPGGGGLFADEADTVSISYSVYPPSTVASDQRGTCELEGCSNSTFVDPITDLESEYCSWKHQEEAEAPKEEALCIMCHQMPRGPKGYFCSKECREKALGP